MAAKRKPLMSSSSDEESDIEETTELQKSVDPVQETPDEKSEEDVEEVEEEDDEEVDEEEEDEDVDEEEDEEVDEYDEEEVEEEDEEEKSPGKQPTLTTPAPADTGSALESGSEPDSPSPIASDFTIRPIASMPTKNKSKPDYENSAKGSGKLWSSDDEITVLEAMVEHQSKKGPALFSDMGTIHESIEGSLHGAFSKNQFCEKVRRLKKKYHITVDKYPKGVDPDFATAHEGILFKLSKTLWSSDNKNVAINNVSSSSNKRKAKELDNGVENVLALPIPDASSKKPILNANWGETIEKNVHVEPIGSIYPYMDEVIESGKGLDLEVPIILRGNLMKEKSGSIEASKLRDLEKKWKILLLDETEHYLKKSELIEEHTRVIFDAMKNSAASTP